MPRFLANQSSVFFAKVAILLFQTFLDFDIHLDIVDNQNRNEANTNNIRKDQRPYFEPKEANANKFYLTVT